MDFGYTASQDAYRERIRALLRADPIASELAGLSAEQIGEPDERPLYRLLGTAGLLAPGWPVEYGGGGRGPVDAAILAEELVRAGVPDTLHVNVIQTIGSFLLHFGSADQRRRLLPGMAAGELFASVLYTEPEAGSDLASVTTEAVRDSSGSGFRITGTKIYSLKTHIADFGLCLARTGGGASRYNGLTLFLVDLRAPGVTVRRLDGIADERFHLVELAGVPVEDADVVGEVGRGWSLVTTALAMERTGLDYALKAEDCLGRIRDAFAVEDSEPWQEALGRYGARVEASGLMAWKATTQIAAGSADPVFTAMAKWYASEAAADVAAWGVQTHGPIPGLDSAYRSAPGHTLSAGTSEVMLGLVAGALVPAPQDVLDGAR